MDRLPFEERIEKFKKGATYLYLDKSITRLNLIKVLKNFLNKDIHFSRSVNLDTKLVYLSSEGPDLIRIASPGNYNQPQKTINNGSYHYTRYVSLSEISKQIIYPDE